MAGWRPGPTRTAYRFDRLAAGPWRITASKGGYVSWQFGQRRPFQPPPPVSLTNGQQFTADIPLTRGGAISGRIYNASGDSVGGAQVRVYARAWNKVLVVSRPWALQI